MVTRLIVACSVMALCVTIHAAGLAFALRWLHDPAGPHPVLSNLRLFIRVAAWIVVLHLVEILAWAALYVGNGALPDMTTAVYFSSVTVHDDGVWRCRPAARLAAGRGCRGAHRHPDVRLVGGILRRGRQPPLPAAGRAHSRLTTSPRCFVGHW